MADTSTFEQWCLVELMGHQQLAGLVSQATFPAGFTRIDVFETDPDDGGEAAFTRIVSPSALYALNPVEKAIALHLAKQLRAKPVTAYQVAGLLPAPEREPVTSAAFDDHDDDFPDGPF